MLHFDGKIWRTLPLLAWHPGELTRRYIEGERARFVSPMALFLFSVFLMFAAVGMMGEPLSSGGTSPAEERAEASRELAEETAESDAKLKELTTRLKRAQATGEPTGDLEARIEGVQLRRMRRQQAYQAAIRHANEEEARKAKKRQENAGGDHSGEFNLIGKTGWPALDEAVEKAEKNPSLVLYKLQTNAYKFSWALIPISVPFVWLLFLHRRRYRHYRAYEHMVFVTYSISFMSLGFVALILLRPLDAGEAIAGLAISFGPPIYMYRQLRGAYRLSRFSAAWRTFLLLIFAWIAASLFLMLLVAVGVLG